VGVDAGGVIRSVSGDIEGILGGSPDAYVGTEWLAAVHPDDIEGATDVVRELMDLPDGSRRTVMVRLQAGNGNDRWVAVEAEVTRILDTHPGLYVAAFRAIADLDEEPNRVEAFLRSVIDGSLDAILVLDDSGTVRWASPSAAVSSKWSRADVIGWTAADVMHPDDVVLVKDLVERVRDGAGTHSVEGRMRGPDGAWRWMRIRISDLRDVQGVGGLVAVVSEVNEEVETRRAMARFASVFDTTEDMVVLTDPDGAIVYANRATYEFLGDDLDSLADRPELAEVSLLTLDAFSDTGRQNWVGEVTLTGITGETRPVSLELLAHRDDKGEISFLSAVGRDISERIELQNQLQRQATHDPLTGLPNRAMLFERIHRASGRVGSEPDHHMALLFIDLDHFKTINDNLGHAVGDRLLGAISRRVRTVVRPGDVVGRFGGDEFVVLCEEVESLDAATAVAGRIASTLEAPFKVDGHEIHVGVSIGIAFADEAADAEAILRDADAAMYRAKSGGRGQWVVFDEELRRTAITRQHLEADLRASRNGESMELHYQPIVDCSTQRVHGVEALLRWRRNGELVSPEVFMQVAEETGLIVSIGEWVIGEACAQLARWKQRSGWSGLQVSVNVSARQIQRPGFVAMVRAAMEDAGVNPGTLSIEITETVLLGDEINAAGVLEELRGLGVSVAIDDFGTGYSSLTYLHALPVDVVKLDRSFVEGVCTDAQKRAIVEAVVNLSAALGLTSVAEGVETTEELDALSALGCGSAQGNLISTALPVGELEQLMTPGSGGLVLRDAPVSRRA
jgi:diguanylate cyclase (GGDEF)-like protein/PAS domain S-box-containing protein